MTKRTILLIVSFFLLLAGALAVAASPKAANAAPLAVAASPKAANAAPLAVAASPKAANAAPLPQQPTPSDNDVNRVAKQLFCPVCENIPLDVCPTQACRDWRELIRQKMAQGWTDEQIKTYFAQQYGDRVLAEPPRSGLNWLVYVLPPFGILIGAGIVWRVLSSMRRRTAPGKAGTPPASGPAANDDPYLARMEEELRNKD